MKVRLKKKTLEFLSNSKVQAIKYEKVALIKGEVRRKMNFTYVLGFVVLRGVVKVFRSVLLRLRERRPGGIEHEVTRGHDAA